MQTNDIMIKDPCIRAKLSKFRVKTLETKVKTLEKEGKLDPEDKLVLKGLKKDAKAEAKHYVKDKRPIVGFRGGAGSDGMEGIIALHACPITAPFGPIGSVISAAAAKDGDYVIAGRLLGSVYFPIGGIAVGIVAAKRAITNSRARKEIFYQSYSSKLEEFLKSKRERPICKK